MAGVIISRFFLCGYDLLWEAPVLLVSIAARLSRNPLDVQFAV